MQRQAVGQPVDRSVPEHRARLNTQCPAVSAAAGRRRRRCRRARRSPGGGGGPRSRPRDGAGSWRLPAASACCPAARIEPRRRCKRPSERGHRRALRRRRCWRIPRGGARAIRKSPDPPPPSPVKTRPVRFAPWAAGARPSRSTRAAGSPKPGNGLRPVDVVSKRAAASMRGDIAQQYTLAAAGTARRRRFGPRDESR